jgi:spore coat protein U-like protein
MKTLTKILLAAAVAGAFLLAPSFAEAQTNPATATMTVQATVVKSCTVTGPASAVNLGNYDPLSATQLSGQGTINVRCVRNTPYTISVSSANGFAMKSAAGDLLPFAIFQPNGTTDWKATALSVPAGNVTSFAPISYIATVKPTVGLDLPAASYTDTVTFSVAY